MSEYLRKSIVPPRRSRWVWPFAMGKWDKEHSIQTLRRYLRIPSEQPNIDYTECIHFLSELSQEVGLECDVYEFKPQQPILIMTLRGKDPTMGGIMLNSHMDVVSAFHDKWQHGPFEAEMDSSGNIYARGAQDTKALGIQYVEALRILKAKGKTFKRNIYVTFVPDEEEGEAGMKHFVVSEVFKALNVAFVIDEGLVSPGLKYNVFYGEKAIWQIIFHINGTVGHSAEVLRGTAAEKLRELMHQVMQYRRHQRKILELYPKLSVADITFINCTGVEGGSSLNWNQVPKRISVTFDMRIGLTDNQDKLTAMIEKWAENAGSNITIEYIMKEQLVKPTSIDKWNPFWVKMRSTLRSLNAKVNIDVMCAGTDSRYLREIGIPCISFSPINKTQQLAHAIDEYINKDVFLRGIFIFTKLIPALANVK